MPEPSERVFEALRAPLVPVDPDPAFAAGLRARMERVLALPRGVIPVTTMTEPRSTTAAPASEGAAIPYLAVADARRALDWYVDILGFHIAGEPIVMPDGRIGHAELVRGSGKIYLADAHPEIGVTAPRPNESTVSLMLEVADADAVRERALAAGASGNREPYDAYGSRNAWIVDPFGHRWGLHSPLPVVPSEPAYRHGDFAYVSAWLPDAGRAAAFYRAVLGWTVEGHRVVGQSLPIGLWSTPEAPTLFCCYAVDDVPNAIARVRAAGGQADEPSDEPFGTVADCTDDQGTRFAVYQLRPDETGDRAPTNGRRTGDLAYVTIEVVDSAKARAFYGDVLGWTFTRGSIPDGWNVSGPVPMAGLSGGHERATVVPMWRVSDIDAAVAAVRANGGTASDPQEQPYGVTAECTDDQGSRFYLGRL